MFRNSSKPSPNKCNTNRTPQFNKHKIPTINHKDSYVLTRLYFVINISRPNVAGCSRRETKKKNGFNTCPPSLGVFGAGLYMTVASSECRSVLIFHSLGKLWRRYGHRACRLTDTPWFYIRTCYIYAIILWVVLLAECDFYTSAVYEGESRTFDCIWRKQQKNFVVKNIRFVELNK